MPDIQDAWYKTAFQNALEGFVLLNPASKIIDVNEAFCRITGFNRDELLSMKWPFPPDQGVENGVRCVCQNRWLCKDGRTIDIETSFIPISDPPGYVFSIIRDITQQKSQIQNLKDTEEKYHSLFENAPVSIWEVDYSEIRQFIQELRAKGVTDFRAYFDEHESDMLHCFEIAHVLARNQFVIGMYEADEVENLGHISSWNSLVLIDRTHWDLRKEIILMIIDGKPRFRKEMRFNTFKRNPKNLVIEYYIPPAYMDSWAKIILVASDITELKNVESRLRQYQEHLESLVEKRTIELEQAKKNAEVLLISEKKMHLALKEQMQQRIEFTHTLVHELKTPLTPMLTTSEILAQALDDHPCQNMAELIYKGASTLDQRIDELMDIARGEIGMLKLNLRSCDILEIVKEVCQYSAYLFRSKSQDFSLHTPDALPHLQFDPERIRQVLINLLDNASKYTQRGGRIALRVIPNSESVVIEVEDNGLGIPQEKKLTLFAHHNRLSPDPYSTSGMGLGLAISKMLIDLHGGAIWSRDNPHETGTIISFSLPCERVSDENIDH